MRRTPPLFPLTALTTTSVNSSTKNTRFSTDPPYESVRALEFVCKNWSGRYPFAAWISTPSNPAPRTALRAALACSCTYSPITSTVSARGDGDKGDVLSLLSGLTLGLGRVLRAGARPLLVGHLGVLCARAP